MICLQFHYDILQTLLQKVSETIYYVKTHVKV